MQRPNLVKTIVCVVLLLAVYPVGLIVMWLIAPWSRGFKIFLTVLLFLPFIGFLVLFSATSKRAQKRINQPLQALKVYKDEQYSISFNYPDNWFISVNDIDPKSLEWLSKGKFLSTRIKTINLTDKPFANPLDPPGKQPFCIFSIDIFRNPQLLSLKDWYGKSINEGEPPKNEEEKVMRDLFLETSDVKINNINALKVVGGDYIFANNRAVFRIDQKSEFECSSGYKVPLGSLVVEQGY